ncbi:hypothetical protein [Thermomonospora amylolytica]|uniref:hypothetical protein n=1 Tax=Thermomonospora amylolytica TaxID=1411117 RepID=UPI000E6C750C|nr:hypothetical protein [Thermomonospora amylolytica]
MRRRIMEAVGAVPLLAQPGRAGLGVFLSLLQDRLPVYAASMAEALGRPGRRSVRENLTLAARATVDFYGEVLPAQTAVLASPEQTAGLRQLTRAGDLGPHHAERMVADYLEAERRFGRVSPEVDALAVAHLLLGGCLGYVFNAVLQGREDLPGAAEYTAAMVRALDLGL